jgi:alpha-D-ribose 1-methylphosphonate 5-triphosphate synthase subunit PhnL
MVPARPAIQVIDLTKGFTLHAQGGIDIPVFRELSLTVSAGECVALHGPSGAGKSTLLRSLYANYKPASGQILVRHWDRLVDMASAPEREVLQVRKHTLGFVSQFLRVVPRVMSLEVVSEPLRGLGVDPGEATRKARLILYRLRIPRRLWSVAPATFSGGEQQRINIARSFIVDYPIMLLDEPTASLDGENRSTVVELIKEAKGRGVAIVGIFHDDAVRRAVADRVYEMKT